MNDRPTFYVLDGDNVVPIEDILDPRMLEQFTHPEMRRIGGTYLTRQGEILPADAEKGQVPEHAAVWVSTIFLAIDHGFPWEHSEPVLFETMVFPCDAHGMERWHESVQVRYRTVADAREGHHLMVLKVRDWLVQHGTLEGFEEHYYDE